MPQGFPTAAGRAQVLDSYRAIFGNIALTIGFTVDEVVVGDGAATALTRSNGSMRVNATGNKSPEANRELFVFLREKGSWRIARYMFNKAAQGRASREPVPRDASRAEAPANQIHGVENMKTMRAAVLDGPGPPEALKVREIPVPVPQHGWALIQVRAFGLNRSELHTRLGLAKGVTFPRVPGIEATGTIVSCPGGEFQEGQQVAAMMGGMGRTFNGGYAEYTCAPVSQLIPFQSALDWAILGAVPEMLQTAHGSLTIGLDAQEGDHILIRGGTSSVGMATAVLAKRRGMIVLSTTRTPTKASALQRIGVDHVVIDDGEVAPRVRALLPNGVDKALELIGTPTLPDTLRATRVHGVVCFTGMLSNQWTVSDFYPIEYLPRGVRLTAYGGGASDLPSHVLQDFLDAVAANEVTVPIHRTFRLDEIAEAHRLMEEGHAAGKLVVLP